MERLTNQKQLILEYLRSVKNHPSAEEIFTEIRKKLPRISLATVYRNLENFAERGSALRISGEVKRYDGDISIHHHFMCQECKKVFDIFEKIRLRKFFKKAEKIGKINKGVFVQGICKKCQKENR